MLISTCDLFIGMIGMYLNDLDELDQKIIQLLVSNAHMSYSDIGKKDWYIESSS